MQKRLRTTSLSRLFFERRAPLTRAGGIPAVDVHVDAADRGGHLGSMSTVVEIQAALAQLAPAQWTEIRRWMDAHTPKTSTPEALEVFRQLQDEVKLTPEGAEAWKKTIAEARR